jgi:hypothetical protein
VWVNVLACVPSGGVEGKRELDVVARQGSVPGERAVRRSMQDRCESLTNRTGVQTAEGVCACPLLALAGCSVMPCLYALLLLPFLYIYIDIDIAAAIYYTRSGGGRGKGGAPTSAPDDDSKLPVWFKSLECVPVLSMCRKAKQGPGGCCLTLVV